MNAIFVFLLSLFFLSQSHGEEVKKFTVAGENIDFYHYSNMHVTLSKPCKSLDKKELCKEISYLKTISLSKAGLKATGGINPASVICKKTLNGAVYIGYDENKNENSFCKTSDGTYIDGGTLTYYALKNEGIQQTPRKKRPPK